MKTSEMKSIRNSRKNTIAFLHLSDIAKIQQLTGVNPDKKSFYEICDEVLGAYEAKLISNKRASAAFEILAKENTSFRTEKFRNDDYGNILKYSENNKAYLFECKGGEKTMKALIKLNGEYID